MKIVTQRGFLSMPLWVYGLLAASLLAVGGLGYGKYQSARADAIRAEYEAFRAKVELLGKQAEVEKAKKETENENRIQTALTDRDNALKRLRVANTHPRSLPHSASAPAGNSEVRFDPRIYNEAMERYRGRLTGSMERITELAIQGDEIGADARALIESWPR